VQMKESSLKSSRNLASMNGDFNDEVSLLTQLAIQDFQCKPTVNYQEYSIGKKKGFEARVLINDETAGQGHGPNKDEAKREAHRRALQQIAPLLY